MNGNNQIPQIQSLNSNPNYIPGQMNFIFRARMLWRDLATWLSMYISSLFGSGVGNHVAISERLYTVPAEYGSILKLFFGDQPAEQLINQLVQFIAHLQSLFIAMMNNDVDSINSYTQQVYQIVDAIAGLLAETNPYWRKNEWVALLNSFTNMNIQEATALLSGMYKEGINIFEQKLSLTNIMGDYFSEGLTYYYMVHTLPRTT
jgi:ABC-type transport system substrate-binding protein